MMGTLLLGALALIGVSTAESARVAEDPASKCEANFDLCVREALSAIEKSSWFGLGVDRQPAQADGTSNRLTVVLIHPAGPAAKAGLKLGDILVATDGQPYAFSTDREVPEHFRSRKLGQQVRFSVIRSDNALISVSIASTPPPPELHRPMLGQYLKSHYGIEPRQRGDPVEEPAESPP